MLVVGNSHSCQISIFTLKSSGEFAEDRVLNLSCFCRNFQITFEKFLMNNDSNDKNETRLNKSFQLLILDTKGCLNSYTFNDRDSLQIPEDPIDSSKHSLNNTITIKDSKNILASLPSIQGQNCLETQQIYVKIPRMKLSSQKRAVSCYHAPENKSK